MQGKVLIKPVLAFSISLDVPNAPDILSPTSPPPEDDFAGVAVCVGAVDLGAVGGYIKAIPNQPLVFMVGTEIDVLISRGYKI